MSLNAEKKKIKKLVDEVPENRKTLALRLLKEMFFIMDTLDNCKKEINTNGVVVTYQNGKNQFGTRANPAIGIYKEYILKFTRVYRDFINLLPDTFNFDETNDLLDFVNEI